MMTPFMFLAWYRHVSIKQWVIKLYFLFELVI